MIAPAVSLCKRFEGYSGSPYLCPARVATIGYGSTHYEDGRKVLMSDPAITEERASALLIHELRNTYLPGVRRQCPQLYVAALLEQDARRLCGILDWVYNLGVGRLQTSTLRRKINAQDWVGVVEQLKLWVRGGGRVLPGLVKRRAAEAEMML